MWEILGIAPTDDVAQIRKAYAARLRAIDADRDLAQFQSLRAAYESALRSASRRTRPSYPPVAQPTEPSPPDQQVMSSPAKPTIERLQPRELEVPDSTAEHNEPPKRVRIRSVARAPSGETGGTPPDEGAV